MQKIILDEIQEKTFAISISNERYSLMQKIFKKAGLVVPQLFHGCTDQSIKPFQRCSRSHIQLIQNAKKIKIPFIVVFEDDAYPCIDCKKKFEKYMNEIPTDANMIILGWSNSQKNKQSFSNHFNKITTSTICGSHAYILMNNAYDNYIDYMTKNSNASADTSIYSVIENTYILDKPLFIQYSKTISMNRHIGYIYYGNHNHPPAGFNPINKMI